MQPAVIDLVAKTNYLFSTEIHLEIKAKGISLKGYSLLLLRCSSSSLSFSFDLKFLSLLKSLWTRHQFHFSDS